ncbi:MAG TPA: hypothetical protein VES95_13780 [Dermatophilaceae bacterium]|nr:hypothetical protein [Dermatophilaceae bacterium]
MAGARTRRWVQLVALAMVVLVLGACAAGPNPAVDTGPDPAGFWLGLWHGFITPVTFLVSLFDSDVSIYEVRNTGGWYDFGYVAGLSMIFGGGAGGGARAGRR